MKKIIFFYLCFAALFSGYSQVGIGNTNPQAALDITSSTDGLLIPRVALTATNVSLPVLTITDSEMVYNTATTGTPPNNVVPGYYYWNATNSSWVSLGVGDWKLTGNIGTTAGINFLGTTDNVDVVFKRNSLEAGRLGLTNTTLGLNALNSNTGGLNNVAIGTQALSSSLTTQNNNAIGFQALNANTANSINAFGNQALLSNTTGTSNNAFGNLALKLNTIAFNNCAFGDQSLMNNTGLGGKNNTAIGFKTLSQSIIGYNVAIGSRALTVNYGGNYNVAIGRSALLQDVDGYTNVAFGSLSSSGSLSSYENTAIGMFSLATNKTGNDNVAIGCNALSNLSLNNNNTGIGYEADFDGFDSSTAIGWNATVTASHMVRIGDPTTTSIGGQVGWTTVSDKRFKKNILNNVPGLNFIKKLRPVTYHLDMEAMATFLKTPAKSRNKESEKVKQEILQTGFIAQEVEQAANDVKYNFSGVDIPKNQNDYYGLRYGEFVVPIVKAVQEQQEFIVKNTAKLSDLEINEKEMETRTKAIEVRLGIL